MKSRYLQYDKKDSKKVLGRFAAELRCRSGQGRSGVRGGSDVRQRDLRKKKKKKHQRFCWGYEGVVLDHREQTGRGRWGCARVTCEAPRRSEVVVVYCQYSSGR